MIKNLSFKTIRPDLIAGFSVFLLAMPLCLGIAMASSFPPAAGIITAIIGGVVTSLIGGAKLSIKGPAAGLIVIVLGSVQELGGGNLLMGYERTLAVGVVASVLQILIAYFRRAVVAEMMPPAVIHGMLMGIGLVIISKQAYVMMGVDPIAHGPFWLLLNIPHALLRVNPLIFMIGLMAMLVVVLWPRLKGLSFIPSSIVVLCFSIPAAFIFEISVAHEYELFGNVYSLGPKQLISLPLRFFDAIHLPDFSAIYSETSIKYIIMLTLVGSIESLLTVCAIDSTTHAKDPTDLNRDLMAVGVGNLVSSFAGGLPMISEIVRSKANIIYGATSLRANFFHGVFLFLAVFFFPKFLNLIPLSALAGILVFVGMQLASPREFRHFYQIGLDQLAVFLITFLITLLVDLLMGVFVGLILELIIHRSRGHGFKVLFDLRLTVKETPTTAKIIVEGPLTFLNYLRLKFAVQNLSGVTENGKEKTIIIDLKGVTYIDHTVLQKIIALSNTLKGEDSRIEENQSLFSYYDHPLSVRGTRHRG